MPEYPARNPGRGRSGSEGSGPVGYQAADVVVVVMDTSRVMPGLSLRRRMTTSTYELQ